MPRALTRDVVRAAAEPCVDCHVRGHLPAGVPLRPGVRAPPQVLRERL